MTETTLIIAFIGGLVTFASPCVLPLIPAYLGYLAGTTLHGAKQNGTDERARDIRVKILINTILFVLGFSAVFALLGVLLHTALVGVSYRVQIWLSRIGGLLIILFGLYLTGLLKIPWLQRERSIDVSGIQPSYVTSFVFGAAFAVGWTPCVGPVLGSLLAFALTNPADAFGLLFVYSLGVGIPFIVVGAFTAEASRLIQKAGSWLRWFNIIVGVALVILGLFVFTHHLNELADLSLIVRILG